MMLYMSVVNPMRRSCHTELELQVRGEVGRASRRRLTMASSNAFWCNCASRRSRAAASPMVGASSANCSSRCCATSSTSSASSWGCSRAEAMRGRMSARQSCERSGISHPGDAVDGGDELLPAVALGLEGGAAVGGEAVEALAPLAGLLDPASDDPPALLHAVEERVEGRDVEDEDAARSGLDELLELVPVSRF